MDISATISAQSSAYDQNDQVVLQHVDEENAYLCGYLKIKNLTDEYPEMVKLFILIIIKAQLDKIIQIMPLPFSYIIFSDDYKVQSFHQCSQCYHPYVLNIHTFSKSRAQAELRNVTDMADISV